MNLNMQNVNMLSSTVYIQNVIKYIYTERYTQMCTHKYINIYV